MSKKTEKKYTRYTREHLRHRNMRFWLCYLALVVLIVLGVMRVHSYFNKNLTRYEEAQYTHVADEISAVFTERRFGELYDRFENTEQDYLETREDYIEYLETLTSGKNINVTRVGTADSEQKLYIVKADDARFAEFSLKKIAFTDEETGEKRYDVVSFELIPLVGYKMETEKYALDYVKTDVLQPVTYDYVIPTSATITVNGRPLGEEQVVESGIKLFYDGYLPANYPVETLTSYRFTCALGTPVIEVKNAEGSDIPLKETGQDTYEYEYEYEDAKLKREFGEIAEGFVKLLCRYTTDNCQLSTINAKVVSGSNAYKNINAIESKWRTKADSYDCRKLTSFNFASFEDSVVSCEVTCTYHTVSKGKVNDYDMHYRVYMGKTNKGWLVYDFVSIG